MDDELFAPVMSALAAHVDVVVDGLWDQSIPLPKTLFHFTDCSGLVGICSKKILFASLATALNDTSETKHAKSWLRSHCDNGTLPLQHIPAKTIRECLNGNGPLKQLDTCDYRTYLASFCSVADEALHWLHYGRSGTGAAIEFDPKELQKSSRFRLCPVAYAPDEQDVMLSRLLDLVDRSCKSVATEFPEAKAEIEALCASLAFALLPLLAPQMKGTAFKSEKEWRLIFTERAQSASAEYTPPKTEFRWANDRIVPYRQISFDPVAVRKIILGASSPMREDEQSLAVLMESAFGKKLPIKRSPVRVRP